MDGTSLIPSNDQIFETPPRQSRKGKGDEGLLQSLQSPEFCYKNFEMYSYCA